MDDISRMFTCFVAPFEILVASIFLYQCVPPHLDFFTHDLTPLFNQLSHHRLLGISAFAGFFVLILGWPLNSFIARRSIRIQKGVMAARDKRMGVLNELIGAVKFIKFFAWEDRWIERALDAREVEMGWMIKGLSHMLSKSLVWSDVCTQPG